MVYSLYALCIMCSMTDNATVLRHAAVVIAVAVETTSGVTLEPAAYVSNSLCVTSFSFDNLGCRLLVVFHGVEA